MKKSLIIASIGLTIMFCSCKKIKKLIVPTPLISKSIDLSLCKNISYTAPVYNNASATVRVTITKIKGKTRQIVWQHNYGPKQLKQYASFKKPWSQKIIIRNVNDKKETLEVSYSLVYNIKGTVLNLTSDTLLLKGADNQAIRISV